MSVVCSAKDLRSKINLKEVPNCPGYYKWWAIKGDVLLILNSLGVGVTDDIIGEIEKKEINGKIYYCIYVGIAVRESLRSRLNWHINQVNKPNNVASGTLSTLRQSIAALFGKDMADNDATNRFIDKLQVEYFSSKHEIKSQAAKNEIEAIENNMMKEHLCILNIQKNKHYAASSIVKSLKSKRKEARKKVTNNK